MSGTIKTAAQRPPEYQTDTQRLQELVNAPVLCDREVAELKVLAARLGMTFKMQHVDLTNGGQVSEYEIG